MNRYYQFFAILFCSASFSIAGGSVDLADIQSLLQQKPALWNIFLSQLDINPHGSALRLGSPGIPLRGARVPPYEFTARLKGDQGPFNLKLTVNADFDFLDELGNPASDEMKAADIKQTLIGFTLEEVVPTLTTRFTDIEHAKRERAFERGWLPPVLPPSTTNITEKNNLDLNTGEGSFFFNPSEIGYFITSGAEAIKIHAAANTDIAKKQKEGFRLLSFSRDSTSWIIAVHPDGRGVYWLESKK